MRRVLGGAIVAVVVLLGLVLVLGPPAIGYLGRIAYDRLLADLASRSPAPIVLQNIYRRGWFSSSADLEVMIPAGAGFGSASVPTRVRLDGRLEQGPGIWLADRFPPVLARIQALVGIDGWPVALPALPLIVDLHLDGSGLMRLKVPPGQTVATADALGLQHAGIDGELRVESDRRTLSGRLAVPGFALPSLSGSVVGRLDLRLDAGASAPSLLTADVGDWLALLRAEGDLEVPEAVALDWLGRGIEGLGGSAITAASSSALAQLKAQSGSSDGAVPSEAQILLGILIRDGWVSRRDDRVASALRLGDGLLTINGKTVPVR
jgi:hypothetical protein